MLDILRIATFLLSSVSGVFAQDRTLPEPFKIVLGDGNPKRPILFCATEQLVVELFQTQPKSIKEVHKKEGCGGFFIPIEVEVIPIKWTSLFDYVAKIRDNFDQEAFVVVEVNPQFARFSLGKKLP